jgi:CheY-like chemotaxis protein
VNPAPFICIIDDQIDYSFLLKKAINVQRPDARIQSFAGGKEFLESLSVADQLPSLILLDRHMPHMNGHQVLITLKESSEYKTIPVIMISAEATADEVKGCYRVGANSFLTKPIGWDELEKAASGICNFWLSLNRLPANNAA